MRPGIRLGVDVGSVRVGLAASDPGGVLATPVETLERDLLSGGDQQAIAALVTERDVLEVVVGLPRSLSGREGPAAATARSYATALAARISPTPVRLIDERLTTIDAHRQLRDSGLPGRAQRAVVDQAAAVLILQAALDAEKSSGRPPGELLAGRKPRTPRASTPRTSTAATLAPGTSTPATFEPGTSTPGTSTPGTRAPGTSTPGTRAPGTSTPEPRAPGTAPGGAR